MAFIPRIDAENCIFPNTDYHIIIISKKIVDTLLRTGVVSALVSTAKKNNLTEC